MLLFWSLVTVAVIALLRGLRNGGKTDQVRGADRLRRLEECYARGELDSEEFRRRRRNLGGSA